MLKSPSHTCATLSHPARSRGPAAGYLHSTGQRIRTQGRDFLRGGLGQPTHHLQPAQKGWAPLHKGEPQRWAPCQLLPLTESDVSWFWCQAENDHGVQFSPLRLLPPGERAPQLPGGSWPFWVGQWEVEDLRPATAKSRDGRCAAARPPLAPKEAQPSSPHPLTGQLPQVPTIVLAGSLASIAAVTASMLGWTLMPR